MARLGGAPVKTFSIGFGEAEFDELAYARLVARASAPSTTSWCWDPSARRSRGPRLAPRRAVRRLLGHPDLHGVAAGRRAREGGALGRRRRRAVRRATTGTPSRAASGGTGFLPGFARRVLGAVGAGMPDGMRGRNYLRHMALPDVDRYLDAITLFRSDRQLALLTPEAAALVGGEDPWMAERARRATGRPHWLSALQHSDLQGYLPLDILTKVDRMSMAHSIEARVPLLDHTLVEFAATIPPRAAAPERRARRTCSSGRCAGSCPRRSSTRPKRGFAIPLGRWFRGPLAPASSTICCCPRRASSRGIFDRRPDPAHRGAAGARAGGSRSPALDADLVRAVVPPVPRRQPVAADRRERSGALAGAA